MRVGYAAAFEQLGWGPETEILDTPISYPDADGEPFTPRNPNGGFQGPTSIRTALGNSFNIPAFKAALYVGVPNVVQDLSQVVTHGTFAVAGPAQAFAAKAAGAAFEFEVNQVVEFCLGAGVLTAGQGAFEHLGRIPFFTGASVDGDDFHIGLLFAGISQPGRLIVILKQLYQKISRIVKILFGQFKKYLLHN
jgi:hypothetical protein